MSNLRFDYVILFLLLSQFSFAQTASECFDKGEKAHDSEQFENAVKGFTKPLN